MDIEKRLTSKELRKIWLRWAMFHLSSMSYEKLQASCWAYSMIPLLEKYYKNDKKESINLLVRHSSFYNTEPQTGAIVNGIITGMEEEKALGKDVPEEMITGVKATLMGPIAGIGDAVIQGIIVPILLSIAMAFSAGGNPFGPIFYIISYGLLGPLISYTCFKNGYKMGFKAIDLFIGESSKKIRDAFNILGVIVVGGLTASYVAFSTKIMIPYGDVKKPLQELIDGNFPKLLPLLIVLFSWNLLANKKLSSTKVILILTVMVSIWVSIETLIIG